MGGSAAVAAEFQQRSRCRKFHGERQDSGLRLGRRRDLKGSGRPDVAVVGGGLRLIVAAAVVAGGGGAVVVAVVGGLLPGGWGLGYSRSHSHYSYDPAVSDSDHSSSHETSFEGS